MSESKANQDPSMEEILASIRRIISEGEEAQAASQAESAESGEELLQEPGSEPPMEAADADDVLDLTEMVTEDGSVVHLGQEDEDQSGSEYGIEMVDEEEPAHGEAEPNPELDAELETSPESEAVPESEPAQEPDQLEPEIEPEPERQAVPPPGEVPLPGDQDASSPLPEPELRANEGGSDDTILSDVAAQASSAAFAGLADSVVHEEPVSQVTPQSGGADRGDSNRTVEELVREALRPMLREWLDHNLPSLVERLVRQEIERLTHRH